MNQIAVRQLGGAAIGPTENAKMFTQPFISILLFGNNFERLNFSIQAKVDKRK